MEWIPKLYDTLDSLVLELRMRWAGHVGTTIRTLMLLVAVVVVSGVSPFFRHFVITTVGALMLVEISVVKSGRGGLRRLFAARRKATI